MEAQHHTWAHLRVMRLIEECSSGPRIPDGLMSVHGRPDSGFAPYSLMGSLELRAFAQLFENVEFRQVDSSCWIACTADQST